MSARVMDRSSRHWWTKLGSAALCLGAVLLLASCVEVEFSDAPLDPAELSTKTQVDCSFDGASELVHEPICYEIAVPEDWSDPDGTDQVVLSVAVFPADDSASGDSATSESTTSTDTMANPDPLIYLEGGPGGQTLDSLIMSESLLVDPFVADRDVIIFDQRGVGASTPNLECAEEVEVELADIRGEIPEAELATKTLDATTACHDRLQADGVNLAAYNSIASAHDINAIRDALGYDQLNVWGTSYGTRLAQTTMRLYPETLRSVVLDSVEPTGANVDEEIASSIQRGIQMILDGCAADAQCGVVYPDLEADFFALLDELDDQPAEIEVFSEDGEIFPAEVDGDDFLFIVFQMGYDKTLFAAVPTMVAETRDGDYSTLSIAASIALDVSASISTGMYHSVVCNEEVPFESAEGLTEGIPTEGDYSRLSAINESPTVFDICEVWSAGVAPDVENEPVESDIPTLVMTGSFDPITPPAYAREVAEHLSNSYFYEFPTEGHGVSLSECGTDLVGAFLDDPSQAPAGSCIDEIAAPQWVPSRDVTLVPFEMTDPFTVSSVRPEGWEESGDGSFYRNSNLADAATMTIKPAGGISGDVIIAGFGGEVNQTKAIDIDGASWETYQGVIAETISIRGMTSPDSEFFVMMTAQDDDELDALFESVAIPAAANLTTS